MIFPNVFLVNGMMRSRLAISSLIFVPNGTKNCSKSPFKFSLSGELRYGKSDGKIRLKMILPTVVIK